MKTIGFNRATAEDQQLVELVEQITAQLQAGEACDIEMYVARYPEYADRLRGWLGVMTAMNDLGHSLVEGSASRSASEAKEDSRQLSEPAPGLLGDFRILCELGRGGMGVVYEAEQISIGRRVALKVLPFAAMLDPQQLNRFKNEARAAGTLDHPNIVAIYSVGSERGVHYYAMQLIEGVSLAEMLAELKTVRHPPETAEGDTARAALSTRHLRSSAALTTIPDLNSREYYRTVARLGIQAAEALDHAHQNGILHRDIKPANLLVDDAGKLSVTDFGLARIEQDAGMTMTGDLLGTLRYMSPEQALAQRVVVDHRSDIYSLGVTLYELLTLQPAVKGDDPKEVLRQIAFDEPRKLRQISAHFPIDLQTILIKAIEKSPADRYSTAQEFANDLRRFLEERPILAKPPSLLNRATKWSRRHRSFVAGIAVLVLIATIASSAGALLLAEEQRKTAAALTESESQKRQLEMNNQLLERERRRAETNLQKARDAVDKLFTRVAEDLAEQPHMDQVRRELLEDALEFYKGFLEQKPDDPAMRQETANTYFRVGAIYVELGKGAEALEPLETSRGMYEELAERNPTEPQYRLKLAETLWTLAQAMMKLNQPNEQLAIQREALTVYIDLHRQYPTDANYALAVATMHKQVALALSLAGKRKDSIAEFQQALAAYEKAHRDFPNQLEDKSWLAHYHHWLGASLAQLGQLSGAEQAFRTSHDLRKQIQEEHPTKLQHKSNLAHIKSYLAKLLLDTGRADQALELYEQAIQMYEECLDLFPDQTDHVRTTVSAYKGFSLALMALGRVDEAEVAAKRAILLSDRQFGDERVRRLAWAYYNEALLLEAVGQHEKSAELFRKTIDSFEKLAAEHPDSPKYLEHLAKVLVACPAVQFHDPHRSMKLAKEALQLAPESADLWYVLGMAQYRAGDFPAAIETLEKAEKLKDEDAISWLFLAMAHWKSGDKATARQWYDKARTWIDKNRYTEEQITRHHNEARRLLEVDNDADQKAKEPKSD